LSVTFAVTPIPCTACCGSLDISMWKAALEMDGREQELPDSNLPRDYRYLESKPVFFGHYWLSWTPAIAASNAACLDFSVAKKAHLTGVSVIGRSILVGSYGFRGSLGTPRRCTHGRPKNPQLSLQ
jgi:hypothetical protein